MKKILFLLVTIVMSLVSCTDQQFLDETLANKALLPTENEFNALIEQARWGDGHACLDRRGARWLLGYHEAGKLQLSEHDVTRLRILSGVVDSYGLQPMLVREYEEPEEIIEVVDTVAAR